MKIAVSGALDQEAGSIDITLHEHEKGVSVDGSHRGTLGYEESLILEAVGGDGSDGLVGADGRDGLPGLPGFPATEFTFGMDGFPGGNGEHGRAGTNGAPAHSGGTIDVSVDEKDLALLSVLSKVDVSAGRPGRAGRHGRGGRGGPGGPGGASHQWQTSYTTSRTEHYVDSEGHSRTRVVDDIHHRMHLHPGGFPGPDGRFGESFQYPLLPGASASEGSFYIHLTKAGKEQSMHAKPYQLEIISPEFSEPMNGQFYEPSETVSVTYQVQNNAPTMSSPPESIPLLLQASSEFDVVQSGEVEGHIAPLQSHVSADKLVQFKIKSSGQYPKATPYQTDVLVHVSAENTRLKRPFQGASRTDSLKVRYPVELSSQETHHSMLLGEIYTVSAVVKHCALKPLGKEAGRRVRVEISACDEGQTGVSEELYSLLPGTSYALKKTVHFDSNSLLGATLQFEMNLYLQPIDRSEDETLIQRQPLMLQLTPKYTPNPNGFLLVIHAETTPEALQYWVERLRQIAGQKDIAIWNTSYYGHFALDGIPSLMADNAHGTVVILDDSFSSRQIRNSQFVTAEALQKASFEHDVSVLVVGSEPIKLGSALEAPLQKNPKSHAKQDEFMRYLLKQENEEDVFLHQVRLPKQSGCLFFRTPPPEASVVELQRQLTRTFPNRAYQVSLGQDSSLNVHRLASPLDSEVKQLPLTKDAMMNPAQFDAFNLKGVISAMPFRQKLTLFAQSGNVYHRELAFAIKEDLFAECDNLQQTKTYGAWWEVLVNRYQHDFNHELKKLRALVNQVEHWPHEAALWSLLIKLIAKVQYHAKSHSTFWTRLAHWFVKQNNELIKNTTLALCEKATVSLSRHMKQNAMVVKKATALEEKRIVFGLDLQKIIGPHEKSVTFWKKRLSAPECLALKQLRDVCLDKADVTCLKVHENVLKSSRLMPWFREFWHLYPELTLCFEGDCHEHAIV